MLYACVQRFDVVENLEKFCKILETKQALAKVWQLVSPTNLVQNLTRNHDKCLHSYYTNQSCL